MRDQPSAELLDLLERLNLASAAQVRSVARRVRHLAGDLPHFDSVWIDALAQARRLTAYQAREINASRGSSLAVGDYRILDRLPSPGYADVFRVRRATGEPHPEETPTATLVLAHDAAEPVLDEALALAAQADAWREAGGQHVRPVYAAGSVDGRTWMVAGTAAGSRAADWMVQFGRFPPHVVLQMARQMLSVLVPLEQRQLLHGDLHVRNLVIERDGTLVLLHGGLRPVLREREGFSMVDLPPEGYETLAPERVRQGTSINVASEIYACGCLWWHLLTGRPAITGGNALAKLKAAAEGNIPDVRQLAPDCPPVLAEMIAACTASIPEERPASFAEVARVLGPATDDGRGAIERCLKKPQRWLLPQARPRRRKGRLARHIYEVATVAACIFVMLGAWRVFVRPAPAPVRNAAVPIAATPPSTRPSTVEPAVALVPPELAPVAPASYTAPPETPAPAQPPQVPPLELPTARRLRLASLSPLPGQTVCGAEQQRACVVVPENGLLIVEPDVCFRDIDFIAETASAATGMLVLQATSARFERCTFYVADGVKLARPAIVWQTRPGLEEDWSVTADRLSLVDCVFYGTQVTIDRQRSEEAELELINVLHVDAGPLVQLPEPVLSAPVSISLVRCTLRESSGAVRVLPSARSTTQRAGRVTVTASDSVFALRSGAALIELADGESEAHCPVRWLGRASVLEVSTALVARQLAAGEMEELDEESLEVVGLVRSPMQFADADLTNPESSTLRRWQAPRLSPDPPGVIVGNLPLPPDTIRAEEPRTK